MIYEKIKNKEASMSVIGLGYVGLPLAIEFGKKVNVIGFDLNREKIERYNIGIDDTKEIGKDELKKTSVEFTCDEEKLKDSVFHIVAVPTPINKNNDPDLACVIGASKVVGRNLKKGGIVVYESTVYPGATEDICVPILEEESGLKCGQDFFVGYSPERINPGDKEHRLVDIVKIVSGMDKNTIETVANIYGLIIRAGVHRAKSIKIAEAAKIIENSQRDINVAFMNELSIIFNKLNIDTNEVLEAARTKWNFLNFYPGLVGGHCIGVDPYYLTHKAEEVGYNSQIILSGRKINDQMGKYIAENTIKKLLKARIDINKAKVCILGITFKENCPDIRNTKVIDIINELKSYGINPIVSDSIASKYEIKEEYNIDSVNIEDIKEIDALVIAVPHNEYRKLSLKQIENMFKTKEKDREDGRVIIDIRGILKKDIVEEIGYSYWSL
ncbi:nucleotide sugar dehydrogenase [Clostridium sp.]|uniref:nucleotide sugar dehydrogenase n=1 Tax=Clostridium sp. TaxID=1506 RepID=UPI003F2E53DE